MYCAQPSSCPKSSLELTPFWKQSASSSQLSFFTRLGIEPIDHSPLPHLLFCGLGVCVLDELAVCWGVGVREILGTCGGAGATLWWPRCGTAGGVRWPPPFLAKPFLLDVPAGHISVKLKLEKIVNSVQCYGWFRSPIRLSSTSRRC